MGKTLIIAEKPSVSKDIAAALGVPKSGDVYENADMVVSHCVGHLVEIYVPEAEGKAASLPIIPQEFSLRAIDRTAQQFKVVKQLMARSDVSTVVNACDAGREGEAIFRLTYELAKCRKPMERMWLQSMTKQGIKLAWDKRQPGAKYDDLANAARSRSEADWLVGINGSRACRQAIGRVMTPTLALVVDRFIENKNFKPTNYFEVIGTFGLQSGEYRAKWVGGEKQITNPADAETIVQKCKGVVPSSVSDESKPTRELPPALFDLTSLQREANRRFKFSAAKTLNIAQALYQNHKVASYPRTDSRHLPEDYLAKVPEILKGIQPELNELAIKPISQGWIKPNKRIFDDSKISDHFAIIPTGVLSADLSADERKIFDMLARRFVAVFYPDAEYTSTVRTTIVNNEKFRATGRVLVSKGWLEVYGQEEQGESKKDDEQETSLPLLAAGETCSNKKIEVVKLQTKAPALFTEAALLSAMESAGKALDDDELAGAMKERGLGTPATRAATIEKLLAPGKTGAYMERQGNKLVPTEKGVNVVSHLKKYSPKMVSPVLTGEWEFKLLQMEKGSVDRESFMQEIADFTRELVATVSNGASHIDGGERADISTLCPKCGSPLIFDGRIVRHEDQSTCDFKLWGRVSSRTLSLEEIETLLSAGELPQMKGFVSKEKKPFEAGLRLDGKTGALSFVFSTATEIKVPCPKCKSRLQTNGKKVLCDCGFSLWTEIAGVRLTDDQLSGLLTEGKTEIIKGFKSKTGKSFSAAVTLNAADFSVSFNFEGVNNATKHKADDKCPKCKKGKLGHKQNKEGKGFLGCSKFPECRFFEWAQ